MKEFNKSQSTGISPGIFERNTAYLIVLSMIVFIGIVMMQNLVR